MSEPIGRIVLREVIKKYRRHPKSWCDFGGGNLESVANNASISVLREALDDPDNKGCIFTMILAQARLVAGPRGKSAAVSDAVKILCTYHRLEHQFPEMSIKVFNDDTCKSVEEAITFIEDALERKTMRERMAARALAAA